MLHHLKFKASKLFECSLQWGGGGRGRGALGFSVLRFWPFFSLIFRSLCQKTSVFRFWCSLQFEYFPLCRICFSVFVENTNGLGFGTWCGFRFSLFRFRFLLDVSGNYAPPLISNIPLYAPLVTTVPDRLRFCQLGCENLTVLTVFGIDRIFAVLRFWMFSFFFWHGFVVSNRPQWPPLQ